MFASIGRLRKILEIPNPCIVTEEEEIMTKIVAEKEATATKIEAEEEILWRS